MSTLIFTYRRQQIIPLKANLNMRLMELRQKLMDLQSYSANIADGSVSMNDLMTSPSSMFNRLSLFMTVSHNLAYQNATAKTFYLSNVPGAIPNFQNPQMQQQYQQTMFQKFYEEEKQNFSKQETKVLNAQETQIQQEIAKIETQLKMYEAEEEKDAKAEDDGIKKSAPNYVA